MRVVHVALTVWACAAWAGCYSTSAATMPNLKSLRMGAHHACALKQDGALSCWGIGEVTQPPAGARFTQFEVSLRCTCGVDAEGRGHCWPSHKRAGWVIEARREAQSKHCVSPRADQRFASISTGLFFHCGLTTEGGVECWGGLSLSLPPGNEKYKQVVISDENVCVLKESGTVACLGRQVPGCMEPPADQFQQISLRAYLGSYTTHTTVPQVVCGVTRAGEVKCWGYPWYDETKNDVDVGWYRRPLAFSPPLGDVRVTTDAEYLDSEVAFELGKNAADMARAAGSVTGVGGARAGQAAAVGVAALRSIPVDKSRHFWSRRSCLEKVPAGSFQRVEVAGARVCAIRTDGKLICWGLGWGCPGEVSVGRGLPVKEVALNPPMPEDAVCVVAEGGQVACRAGMGSGELIKDLERR